MDRNQRGELFRETANRMDPDAVIEKDFWVCWVLKQLFSIETFSGRLLFKGGTSLSKIFRAIHRFSEDIDLAVDYAALGFTGPRDPRRQGLSRTQQTKLLAGMLRDCRRFIADEFTGKFRTRCENVLGPDVGWNVRIDDHDPHTVRFHYPAATPTRHAYIAPQVVLWERTRSSFRVTSSRSGRMRRKCFQKFSRNPKFGSWRCLRNAHSGKRLRFCHAQYHRAPGKPIPGRYSQPDRRCGSGARLSGHGGHDLRRAAQI